MSDPHTPDEWAKVYFDSPISEDGVALADVVKRIQLQARREERERCITQVDACWSFDSAQQHTHTWHCKQECFKELRAGDKTNG